MTAMTKPPLNRPGKRSETFGHDGDAVTPGSLARSTCHGPQDFQSLAMHRAAVSMVKSDPSLIRKALAILAHWDMVCDPGSKPLRDEWVRILNSQDWTLALEDSDLGNQLRQASPMAALLPQEVRLGIIREVKLKVAMLNE